MTTSNNEVTCLLCDRQPTVVVTTPTGGEGRCSLPYCTFHYVSKFKGESDD
jgi:hypothetical protein